jgi:hypothetical protein
MKRDEMRLPEDDNPPPKPWELDPVREGMNYYYQRWPEQLEKLLKRLASNQKEEK